MELVRALPPLYKPTSDGKTQVWFCEVYQDGDFGVIVTRHGKQGGKMQETRDVIREGKNLGHVNATTPVTQALAEADAEHEMKQRRKGYALDVADSNRGEAPMLAQKFKDLRGKIDYTRAVGQRKLNGFRCISRMTPDAKVLLFSREHGAFDLPHVAEALLSVMQPGDVFDGEIYVHGMTLQQISSLIKRPRDDSAKLEYNLYDAGIAKPYIHREALLAERLGGQDRYGPLVLLGSEDIPDERRLLEFQADCIAEGYEGAMLRWGDFGYEFGKRSKSLVKVKTFLDEDFEVVGAKEGRGGHEGMAIFTCKTPAGHTFDVTSPGTHVMKRHYWLARNYYMGCLLTVKFQEYTKSEQPLPFHPHAVGFRAGPKLAAAEKAMKAAGFDLSLFDTA